MLISVGVIIVVLALTLSHYHEFLGKGTPPTLLVNNLCSPCSDSEVPEICDLPKEYQFEKVIWFITDGMSYNYYYVYEIFIDREDSHINHYKNTTNNLINI